MSKKKGEENLINGFAKWIIGGLFVGLIGLSSIVWNMTRSDIDELRKNKANKEDILRLETSIQSLGKIQKATYDEVK